MKFVALAVLLVCSGVARGLEVTNKPPRFSPAAGRRTVGVIDFQGTPMFAVVEYVAHNLLDKPLITPWQLYGTVTYRSPHDLTVPEAVTELTGALASNGWQLIEVDARYYRLRPMSETNRPPDRPHIEMLIEHDGTKIDDTPVTSEEIAGAIQKRMTDETELWIYDARNDGRRPDLDPMPPLPNNVAVSSRKVFRAYVPRRR